MSNPFFTWSFDVAPGSSNKSRPVENEFAAVQAGFNGVYGYLQRALLAPTGETPSLLPTVEARKNKAFVWDSAGNPSAATTATSSEMSAAVAAAASAASDAATASAAAASVSASSNYIQQLMLAQGVI